MKEAEKQTKVSEAIAGLSDETQTLVKLLAEESAEYEKQATSINQTIQLSKQRQNELKKELGLVESAAQAEALSNFTITGVGISPEATRNLQEDFNQLINDITQGSNVNIVENVTSGLEESAASIARLQNEIIQAQAAEAEQESRLAELREASLKILREQIKQFKAQNTLINEQQALTLATDASKIAKLANDRANATVKQLTATQAESQVLKANIALETQRRTLSLSALQREINLRQGVVGQEAELVALQDQFSQEVQNSTSAVAVEAAEIANIERRLERITALASNDFTQGLREGLSIFAEELEPFASRIAEIITGSLTDLAGTVGDVFKDAIDPRADADLSEAFGEFFLNLAGQFVEAVTASLIQKGLEQLLNIGAEVVSPQVVATNANTLSLAANTTAMATLGTVMGGLIVAMNVNSATGSTGLAKGGVVKAFASGGNVGSLPRPSSIPKSDTVPAWLTPGEFVVKKSSVQKYGSGFLSALNDGILNPKSFSVTGLALGGMAKGVQGFARGGSVRRTSGGSGSSPNVTQTVVLPVLPTTEGNMEQMISGGRTSFNSNINKAPLVGDPNRSGNW